MIFPEEIKNILQKLEKERFDALVVGGCVRDLLLGHQPQDWDITTNAKPEEIQKIFPDSFYENQFGTVGVKTGSKKEGLEIVEITTFRIESRYSDRRHPDAIKFADTLAEDLRRRDFTINALALDSDGQITDLFGGQADLKQKIVRAVGQAEERFAEDALRLMRAVRLAISLNFELEEKTREAIKNQAARLRMISPERLRDELIKIIESDQADQGIELLRLTNLLSFVIPELLEGVGVEQNLHHIYTVWEHNLRALKYASGKKYSPEVRLASLLHDVGKPRSKRGEERNSTFYGHEIIGAKMTAKILDRLHFPKDQADKITKLVRWHLFYYNVGEVTESSVRRLVAHIGKENVEDLLKVREADRIGSGTPKAVPYKLRHLKFMIDKVARDPISPKMLKTNGTELMEILSLAPGPRLGLIITALMEEVLDTPEKNQKDYLQNRAWQLNQMSEEDLKNLAQKSKKKVAEEEKRAVAKIKAKHYVQ